jgi:hypothetical protein
MNQDFSSQVRTMLLRLQPGQDPALIAAFLASARGASCMTAFETLLIHELNEYQHFHMAQAAKAASARPPVAPMPAPAMAAAMSEAPSPEVPAHETIPPSEPAMPTPERPALLFRLQNGRVGEPYAQPLMRIPSDAPPVVLLDLTLPPELGLLVNLTNAHVAGCPALAGEFDLALRYHFAADAPDQERQASVKLLINPDPKSLWKDLPSDRSAPFWRADAAAQWVQGSELSMIAASKRGRSHAHVGSFRDDDFALSHLPDSGWYCAVVADGAGSAKYARRGASIVCQQAMHYLEQSLNGPQGEAVAQAAANFHAARALHLQESAPEKPAQAQSPAPEPAPLQQGRQQLHHQLYQTVGYAAYHAVKAIVGESTQPHLQASYQDFSTTALITACRRFPFGVLCAAYWVGDGALGIYSKTGGIQLLGEADGGEYSGQTRFLNQAEVTQDALLRRTRFALVDDFTALMLMTDGVSDPKFETEAKLAQAAGWDSLWQELEQATGLPLVQPGIEQRLLAWLDFWSTGNHDDRTLAIILPGAAV